MSPGLVTGARHSDAESLGTSFKSGFSAKSYENPVQYSCLEGGRGSPVTHSAVSLAPPPELQAEQFKQEGFEKRG